MSWADEFTDFSVAKRSALRVRMSAGDCIAFHEASAVLDHRRLDGLHEFDRLDEEQLMSMFSDDAPPMSSDSGPASENNSANEGKRMGGKVEEEQRVKSESEEANSDHHPPPATAAGPAPVPSDPIADPKRIKRILANRQSAQRSRVRKLQYISELERSVTCLQTEVSLLSPRVAFFDHQRSVLTVGNSALRQRIAALAQDKIFKDAHQEALKKEIERLRQVYNRQSVAQNMAESAAAAAAANTSVDAEDDTTEGGTQS